MNKNNYSKLGISSYSNQNTSIISNTHFIPFNSSIYDKPFSCVYTEKDNIKASNTYYGKTNEINEQTNFPPTKNCKSCY
jgi:hypothetical protein